MFASILDVQNLGMCRSQHLEDSKRIQSVLGARNNYIGFIQTVNIILYALSSVRTISVLWVVLDRR